MRLTEDEYRALIGRKKPAPNQAKKKSKYRNVKTIVSGKVFASGHEARRYAELELLQSAGQIRNLRRQVPYDMVVNGQHICTYIADAVYESRREDDFGRERWDSRVEDAKSKPTRKKPDYVLKRKLMAACHSIRVEEIL